MGFIISINGSSFTPYDAAASLVPLVQKAKASNKVEPIDRRQDHPGGFQQALKGSTPVKTTAYEKAQSSSKTISRKIILAKELMTSPVISSTKDTKVFLAQNQLKENNIRHLPIVDSDKKLIGIISERNLLRVNENTSVGEVMSKKVIAAQSGSRLQEIAKVMVDHKINSIPIVDEDRYLIGIITSSDILTSVFKNPNVDLWA